MAGPLPGGDKQALIDAYGAAKASQPSEPDADDSGAGAPSPDGGDPTQQLAGDPELKSVQLQLQHLEHLLVARGVISPTDLITPPAPAAPMAPPPGPPMGAPPGGPPLQ